MTDKLQNKSADMQAQSASASNKLIEIAKANGAKTHGYIARYLQETESILFENEAQLQATIDAFTVEHGTGDYIKRSELDAHTFDLGEPIGELDFYLKDDVDELLDEATSISVNAQTNNEPVAYNHHFIQDDDFMPEEVLSHSPAIPLIHGCKYAGKTDCLYTAPPQVNDALEKAANICDDLGEAHSKLRTEDALHGYIAGGADMCADAIRALKDTG